MALSRLLAFGILMMTAAFSQGADRLSGTAIYRERIAAPPDARFVAVLEDVSRADAPAIELGRAEIVPAGNPPYAFEIDVDPSMIEDNRRYAVRAMLYSQDRLLFTTDTMVPVLSGGAPWQVDLVMRSASSRSTPAEVAEAMAPVGAHGLRLPASFTGTLPCADCEGIAWHLDLWPDQAYHLRRRWLGREDAPGQAAGRDEVGRWYADPTREAIVLHGAAEMPIQWQVLAPDRLRLLDQAGEPIESALNYEITSHGTLSETDIEGVFLGGMMTYLADAALFEDCMTGHRYPIAQEGDYLALERAYVADRAQPGAPLYVHVEGALLMRPAMEGPDRRSLVVERFIKTRPGVTCERQRAPAALANTYWRIDQLRGETLAGLPGRREPHMILRGDEQRFTATLGCNRMLGGYAVEEAALTFSPGPTTLMACPPPLDRLERDFIEVLAAARSHAISGETLVLRDAADDVIAVCTAVYLP